MNELVSILSEIKVLEDKKKELSEKVLEDLQKPISVWMKELSLLDFKICIHHLFTEKYNRIHGTDYFTWNETEKIQKDFEKFVVDNLESRYFYDVKMKRLFRLKVVKNHCTVRRTNIVRTFEINKKGNLVYKYIGNNYNGFNQLYNSTQQELEIDLVKMCVVDYDDSTQQYHSSSSGGHKLKTDFIKKLIKEA